MTKTPFRSATAALVCAVTLASCKTGDMSQSLVDAASVVPTLNVSASRQRELGDAAAAKTLKMSLVSDDTALVRHLNGVLARLVRASGASDDYVYRLHVLDDPQLNAFTPGGGHMFITTGLIRALKTEAQVAAVIAHELAHITESHVVRGMRDRAGIEALTELTATAVGLKTKHTKAVYDYSVLAAVKGHGRHFESKADELGLETLVKAGYVPEEMLKVFEALKAQYGDRSELANFFHGSHPTNQKRIETLSELIAERYGDVDRSRLVRDTAAFRGIKKSYPAGPGS